MSRPVNEKNLPKYEKLLDLTYRKYAEHKNEIEPGFITAELVKLVSESLNLNYCSDEELNELWFAGLDYFDAYIFTDETRVEYKTDVDIRWYMDCWSAWSEVINSVARRRRMKKEEA